MAVVAEREVSEITGNTDNELKVQYAFWMSKKALESIIASPAYRIFSGQPLVLSPEVQYEPHEEIPQEKGLLSTIKQLPAILARKMLVMGEK